MSRMSGIEPPGEEKRLPEWLLEDLEGTATPQEIEELLPVVGRLRAWKTPEPSKTHRAAVIASLLEQMPEARQHRAAREVGVSPSLLLRSQVQVVRTEIWLASVLVIAVGLLATMAMDVSGDAETVAALPLVILAPVAASISIALLYDSQDVALLEVELSTVTSPRLLLLSRLLLIFGFNLLVTLLASCLLAVAQPSLSLWPLVVAWLAPMSALSSLAYLMASLGLDPIVSMLVGFALWTLQQLVRVTSTQGWLHIVPDLTTAEAQPLLFTLALAMGAAAIWASGREATWLGGRR